MFLNLNFTAWWFHNINAIKHSQLVAHYVLDFMPWLINNILAVASSLGRLDISLVATFFLSKDRLGQLFEWKKEFTLFESQYAT